MTDVLFDGRLDGPSWRTVETASAYWTIITAVRHENNHCRAMLFSTMDRHDG